MHEAAAIDEPPFLPSRSRRRKRWLLVPFLVTPLVAAAGIFLYLSMAADEELRQAIAEADRTDPGWRLAELEAARRKIPDEENSAIPLGTAAAKLPARSTPKSDADILEQATLHDLLFDVAQNLEPPVLLDPLQVSQLRRYLKPNARSLAEIYKIKDMPHGRYAISYAKDFIGTPLRHTQDTRALAFLLEIDALLRAHDHDLDGAFLDCRCLIHAERAIGDEPIAVSMMVRFAIRKACVKKIERILAQGEPSESALATSQRLLEEELDEQPLMLIAARGERGGMDGLMEALQKGEIANAWNVPQMLSGPTKRPGVLENVRFKYFPGSLNADRAALLRHYNRIVEFAKLPVDEQRRRIEEFNLDAAGLPPVAVVMMPDWPKLVQRFHRDQATLRCGVLLLAAERYRVAHHRWPHGLDELVPRYIRKVPLDPLDGQPMRQARFADGVVIYSVGYDGQDNGGNIDAAMGATPGTDLGYRLWNVDKRRQPAMADKK